MWKMYNRNAPSGSTGAFWDQVWDQGTVFVKGPANTRVCEGQGPLARLMLARVVPDRLFLEGGCGPANWARYFHERGHRSVGVDFAPRAVERVKHLDPTFDIRVGDVNALPFADGEVHSYYSGGVVEHFETGPEPALREARRVLASDGYFFCSVPDSNIIRTGVAFRLNGGHPAREVQETRQEPTSPDLSFFQYTFGKQEFISRLEDAGFRVEDEFGYSLVWGLMEFPGVPWVVESSRRLLALSRPANSNAGNGATPGNGFPAAAGAGSAVPADGSMTASSGTKGVLRRAIERVALQEDTTIPVVGPLIARLREHCSNMRMYVARPR